MSFIRNAWYCAAFSSEVGRKPLGRTILDELVALFRREDGTVVAVSGICPHRFAPLHQGRLEGDVIFCPYHGLGFDSRGHCVHNPHGRRFIPPRSDIRTYPVIENQGVVWIWTGSPVEMDPATIVDLRLIGPDDVPRVSGYMRMNTGYRLIIDNLLDLTHAPYLHAGTLSPAGKTREMTSERGQNYAASHYLMRSVQTPLSQQLWFEEAIGDYYVSIEWTAPCSLRQFVAMTREGRPPEDGAMTRGAHLLTPETETTTHYFWITSRNVRPDDLSLNAKLVAIVENAFRTEDGPMMEACQRNMKGRDFSQLRPLFLETDAAAGHARSILEKLAANERRVSNRSAS